MATSAIVESCSSAASSSAAATSCESGGRRGALEAEREDALERRLAEADALSLEDGQRARAEVRLLGDEERLLAAEARERRGPLVAKAPPTVAPAKYADVVKSSSEPSRPPAP